MKREDDPKLRKAIEDSAIAVTRVAHWLHLGGPSGTLPGWHTYRKGADPVKTLDERRDEPYDDLGDLYAKHPVWTRDKTVIIEVKRLSKRPSKPEFTCLEDWPFSGRNTIRPEVRGKRCIVDGASSFNKKVEKRRMPFAYVFINYSGTHCGWIDVKKSYDGMFIDMTHDPISNELKPYVYVMADEVQFYHMDDGFPLLT